MGEWWSYRAVDFLLYSPQTYQRLIERYNRDLWPLHLAGAALALALVALLWSRGARRARAIGPLLGLAWLWVAWGFLAERYASINWTADAFAIAFALEAVLLALASPAGALRLAAPADGAGWACLALFGAALVAQPLAVTLGGAGAARAEVFAIAPDPTAVATLALLALARGPVRWLMMIVPLAWCAASATLLHAMGSSLAPATALAAAAAPVLAALGPALERRAGTRRRPGAGGTAGAGRR